MFFKTFSRVVVKMEISRMLYCGVADHFLDLKDESGGNTIGLF